MNYIPAIDGYDYNNVFEPKSNPVTCRLDQCNKIATRKCSKSLCPYSFCAEHAMHKHFLCDYCCDNRTTTSTIFATCEIIVDKQLACESCWDHLLSTRCCRRCRVWLTKKRSAIYYYCYKCSPKCKICSNSTNGKNLCFSCESTQQACYTQNISGYYGYFK